MQILIIPDSFKESLTATEVARALYMGVHKVLPEAAINQIPFSDGGEGALEVLKKQAQGVFVSCQTENALGEKINAPYFLFEDQKSAWIELSQASGLAQIAPEKRDALNASTYGTGLQIKDAIARGCNTITLGLGGSATTDGGAGLFEALGGVLLDHKGAYLERGGLALKNLSSIILPKGLDGIYWKVACDVDNPLLGPSGAASVYGPQKGASALDVVQLDRALSQFATVIHHHFGRQITTLEGGGAAGGTAAGMYGFFNATLQSGFSLLSEMIGLEKQIKQSDLIITAEGKMDGQSLQGKLTGSVAHLGKKHNIPVVGIAGALEGPMDAFFNAGFAGVFSIQNGPLSLKDSMENAEILLSNTAANLIKFYISKP